MPGSGHDDSARDVRELEQAVERLTERVEKAEAKAAKWKRRAKRARRSTGTARPAVRRAVERVKDTTAEAITITATAVDPSESTAPRVEWSLTRLRAEARQQNVPGYSTLTKEQLVAALGWTRPPVERDTP